MKSFFVLFFLVAICHARKKCHPVCPDFFWPLENTMADNIVNYFQRDTPEDGLCTGGKPKYIFYGPDFGHEQNRCVCLTSPISQYKECGTEIPQCPSMPIAYKDEIIENYLERVGQELEGGPADGCCPFNSVTVIAEAKYTNSRSNLCYCMSQSNLRML